ncbi:MAG: hypothetical protein F4X58_06000, partial [Chloroflexi bacterium]|nr:hypothetical protein [Chloroflexota bacterium]
MDFYEHRVTMVEPKRFPEYRELFLKEAWPRLVEAGFRPLCLLNPAIGGTPEEVHSFIGFPSWDEWRRGQEILVGLGDDAYRNARRGLIVNETARPKIPYSGRPLAVTPDSDRRAVYGLRRWTIDPDTWERFAHLTEFGVWPAMDAMGHRVLGNFYDAVLSDDLEVTNLAGYHSVGNWHATRTPQDPGSGVSPELLKLFQESGRERHALTRHTWVQV